MKILIAYDGSACAEAALDDLASAGLPEAGEFRVISVAEVWLAPDNLRRQWEAENSDSQYLLEINRKNDEKSKKAIAEVETLLHRAVIRLQKIFPGWTVAAETAYGSPAWEILSAAAESKPDLIVAGSHGRSALGRFFLGSISQKVLTEADCSVRIARGKIEVDSSPARVVIGFDGSPGARAAVEAVAARHWRAGSEFRLLVATEAMSSSVFNNLVPSASVSWISDEMNSDNEILEKLAVPALQILKDANCPATLWSVAGNPKQVLIEEAENWHADAIFVGANRFGSRLERFLLGSVSQAVAARAHCTVEVVRKQQ